MELMAAAKRCEERCRKPPKKVACPSTPSRLRDGPRRAAGDPRERLPGAPVRLLRGQAGPSGPGAVGALTVLFVNLTLGPCCKGVFQAPRRLEIDLGLVTVPVGHCPRWRNMD